MMGNMKQSLHGLIPGAGRSIVGVGPAPGTRLRPRSRGDVLRLETYLLLGTLMREDVLERVRGAGDRLTFIDSLALAAGALARHVAGVPIDEIAEELGRDEAAVREHLRRETEAGELVWGTYEMLVRGELEPLAALASAVGGGERIRERLREVLGEI